MVLDTMRTDPLSATFAALADPTRRQILAQLAKGEANVTELSKPFEMSQPAISKHLKVLERAGLIVRGREAQFRPCRLSPAPLQEANDWAFELRRRWEARLDRLGDYLAQVQAAPAHQRRPSKEKRHGTKNRRR